MASRPKNPNIQNRRILSDLERIRLFGSIPPSNSDFPGVPLPSHYLPPGNLTNCSQGVPPPLPPRTDTVRSDRLSNYNSYCSPYSRYSPVGMYSGYGGYRTPYSRYGMPSDSYSNFAQLAEESTRPAFESIESVVDIVGSISMMLESTYHAVYSSYNAIIGVVDQFSRLRDHLAEVLSFLALIRGLRYLCLKILYLLRLRKDNPSVEAAWSTAKSISDNPDFSQFQNDKNSPWPFFMFVGLVVGAPWLMFKLLSRSVPKKPFDINSWKENNSYLMSISNYDFTTNRRGELSFKAGEQLFVAPRHLQTNVPKGWFLACNKSHQIGLVPRNYLKAQILEVRGTNPAGSNVLAKQIPVMPEKSKDPFENFPEIRLKFENDAREFWKRNHSATLSPPCSEVPEKKDDDV